MNSKLRCILLDDEVLGLKYLKILCEQLEDLEVVKAYIDPEVFINEMDTLDYDFCILDIEMPKLSGLQVANLLREKSFIFVTAYREYALDAFEVNAIDYLQKPIKKERLLQAIEKVKKYSLAGSLPLHKPFIQVNTEKGRTLIHYDKIGYITISSIDSRDKLIVYKDGSELILKNITLDKLLQLLPQKQFLRINKKEIINLFEVKHFSNDEIFLDFLTDRKKLVNLALSEVYKSDFYARIKS